MRKIHLLYLIAVIVAGITFARLVSTGGVEPPSGRAAADETRNPQAPATGQADFALRGTALLAQPIPGDFREEQRQQIIRYFTAQIAATPAKRGALWHPDFSSPGAYRATVEEHRAHLREMLGIVDVQRRTAQIKVLFENASLRVEDLTLPTDAGLSARALLFFPKSLMPVGSLIAIPPASESREEFAGVMQGTTPAPWLGALLARNVAVAVPITIERRDDHPICRAAGGKIAAGFCGARGSSWAAPWWGWKCSKRWPCASISPHARNLQLNPSPSPARNKGA